MQTISLSDFNGFPEDYQKVIIKYIAVARYYDLAIQGFNYRYCSFHTGFLSTTNMPLTLIDKLIAKIPPK